MLGASRKYEGRPTVCETLQVREDDQESLHLLCQKLTKALLRTERDRLLHPTYVATLAPGT